MSEIYTISKPAPTQEPDLFEPETQNTSFELIKLLPNGKVNARRLYQFLGFSQSQISRWFKTNITDNEFAVVNVDYWGFDIVSSGNITQDFELTVSFAKELCMLARNEQGKKARLYFIEMEQKAKNSTAPVMQIKFSEALKIAYELQLEKEANQPLIEFAEAVRESKNGITIGQFAKVCGTGEYRLFKWLRDQGYLISSGPSYNMPKQKQLDNGYFTVREVMIGNGETRFQTLITGKGQLALEGLVR
jgi:anti-repressor protein